jgi:hypothetical protein
VERKEREMVLQGKHMLKVPLKSIFGKQIESMNRLKVLFLTVLVLGCTPRHKDSVTTEQVLPADDLFRVLACSCIANKMQRYGFDSVKDGSIHGYIMTSDFGMQEFLFLSDKVIEQFEKNPPKSYKNHTLELMACMDAVEVVLKKYKKGEYVIPKD